MILLWDSSEMQCRFALVDDEITTYEWEAGRTLARDMLAQLREALRGRNASFRNLAGIGVFAGPGSFTGLRIGLTVLNTMARTNQIPIVGASGENWQAAALARLEAGENDQLVMPLYGSEAHITKPRK